MTMYANYSSSSPEGINNMVIDKISRALRRLEKMEKKLRWEHLCGGNQKRINEAAVLVTRARKLMESCFPEVEPYPELNERQVSS